MTSSAWWVSRVTEVAAADALPTREIATTGQPSVEGDGEGGGGELQLVADRQRPGRAERLPVGALRAAAGRRVDAGVRDSDRPDAAADVTTAALALTLGVAAVAADHPVAPTAVRARLAVSDVPFAE